MMHQKHIVVCDDDPDILQITTLILRMKGYTVTPISDWKHLVEKVRTLLPDLILLDNCMPGMLGKDLSRTLKAQPDTAGIPIILFSAINNLAEEASDAHVDAYIAKPFERAELEKLVAQYLSRYENA